MLFISNRDISASFTSATADVLDREGPSTLNVFQIARSSLENLSTFSDSQEPPANLLFVHGFNTSLRDAMFSGLKLESLYNTRVATFSWPSRTAEVFGRLPSTYWISRFDARYSAEALARLVLKMSVLSAQQSFVVAAHSMGNLILKSAVKVLMTQGHWPAPHLKRVLMIAADLPEKGHATEFRDIAKDSEVHIVQNKHDYALVASSLMRGLNLRTRLGQIAHERIPSATYHDFSGKVGRSHSYFVDKNAKDGEVRELFESLFESAGPKE